MISNNSLSNHLNSFKNKKKSQKDSKNISTNSDPNTDVIGGLTGIIVILFKTFIYGYGIKIILNINWNLLEVMCIGTMITLIFEYIYNLFHD